MNLSEIKKKYPGDFVSCNFCNAIRLVKCSCKTCKIKPEWAKGLTCGEHHQDHQYLVKAQQDGIVIEDIKDDEII
jgi:hypothetical protein